MANYEHIVQEHIKLHESLFNKQADIIKEASELRDIANELNIENLQLKKILYDVLPMVKHSEFCCGLSSKYSEIIESIVSENTQS